MVEHALAERSWLRGHDLALWADVPVVHQGHHLNTFWDQTIDDALGVEQGADARAAAAREAFHDLLHGLCTALDVEDPEDRVSLAEGVFSAMGLGRLTLEVTARGGSAIGHPLHHGAVWNERFSARMRRAHPADAVSAGFAAAATEVAFGLPRESVRARERECVVQRHPRCVIELVPQAQARLAPPMRRGEVERVMRPSFDGYFEGSIAPTALRLREVIEAAAPDERGLVRAFGVHLTLLPTTYYNRTGGEALRAVARRAPASVPVLEALLREAGRTAGFFTFGRALTSREWEDEGTEVEEIVAGCVAVARALGWGHWTVAELAPQQRLVLRMPANHECVYRVSREGPARLGTCHFTQGAALAVAELAHRVAWATRPPITEELFTELSRAGAPWRVDEPRCIARGDRLCEVVLTRAGAARTGGA